MLALSSLHLAFLRPTEAAKYELQATHHQHLALPLFRAALIDVTASNCHALYACGHLVTKGAFASQHLRRGLIFSPTTETTFEFFSLLRGAFSIHNHAYDWLANGPLAFCLEQPLDNNPKFDLYPDDAHLARLLSTLLANDSEDVNICCGALNSLRKLFAMASTPHQTISTKTLVFSWPMEVSERYLKLVGEHSPEALLVLAHYCVMLKMVDSFWFMRGSAVNILRQCQQILEPRWQQHIDWPIKVVGIDC